MIWIDYGPSSPLSKTGLGPITSATQFRMVSRLDRAGEFSFTMPASDPKANDLTPKTAIIAYTESVVGPQPIGWGIIESVKVDVRPNEPTMLEVAGTDFLHMLQNVSVRDLALYDENSNDPTQVAVQPTGTVLYNGTTWGTVTFDVDAGAKWLYVEDDAQFHAIVMTISGANTVAGIMQAQYHTGDDAGSDGAWVSLDVVDGTSSGGVPYAQSGTVTFEPPANWTVEGTVDPKPYVVRLHSTTNSDTVTLGSPYVKILQYEPTPTALAKVDDYFPAGWTWDTVDGDDVTLTDVYLSMSGESVLQTLVKIAEQTGEHFIANPAIYQVKWLNDSQLASGYRIAAPLEGTTGVVLPLTRLERDNSTYDYVSRIIPYGGGNGESRITLADTARTASAGYTLDKTNNTLEKDSPTYGTVEKAFQWPEIVAATNTAEQTAAASNSLYDRAYETLQRLSQLQAAYRVSCVSPYHVLEPGKTVRLVYREVVDSYVVADVDADLWILEIAATFRQANVVEYDLLVSTVDRWPTTDAEMIVGNMGRQETNVSIVPPDSGLEDAGSGVFVPLSVRAGKVTAGARIVPAADGLYTLSASPNKIRIVNGIVTEINP